LETRSRSGDTGVLSGGLSEPWVAENATKGDPLSGGDVQAGPDQVLDLFAEIEGGFKEHLGPFDLVICLKGDVTTDHVI